MPEEKQTNLKENGNGDSETLEKTSINLRDMDENFWRNEKSIY